MRAPPQQLKPSPPNLDRPVPHSSLPFRDEWVIVKRTTSIQTSQLLFTTDAGKWYFSHMVYTTTIDESGRFTVPKALRDSLNLSAGTKVLFTIEDGLLHLKNSPTRRKRRNVCAVPTTARESSKD